MEHEKKLSRWVTGELCKQKPCTRFVLKTAAPGRSGTPIDEFEIEHRMELEEIPPFAANIIARAQEDADGCGPVIQRYVVLAFRKGDTKPVSKFPFRMRGEMDVDLDEESGEEPATMKGLLMQLMRHNEATTRTLVQATATLMTSMTRRLESSDKLTEGLIKDRTENFKMLEEARSEQHTRDMDLMLTEAEQSRKDKAFEKLMTLVPLVINKIAGQKILPDSSDPLMMMLEPLIGSLNQEQFAKIQSTLNPEQTIMFVEMLQAFQKHKQLTNGTAKEN
jgi:hypothetical protein